MAKVGRRCGGYYGDEEEEEGGDNYDNENHCDSFQGYEEEKDDGNREEEMLRPGQKGAPGG